MGAHRNDKKSDKMKLGGVVPTSMMTAKQKEAMVDKVSTAGRGLYRRLQLLANKEIWPLHKINLQHTRLSVHPIVVLEKDSRDVVGPSGKGCRHREDVCCYGRRQLGYVLSTNLHSNDITIIILCKRALKRQEQPLV